MRDRTGPVAGQDVPARSRRESPRGWGWIRASVTALCVLLALGALATLTPGAFGAWRIYPFVQVMALPSWLILGLAATAAAAALVLAVAVRRNRRRGHGSLTGTTVPMACLVLILVVAAVVHGWRFVSDGGLTGPDEPALAAPARDEITVMSFNANGAEAESIAEAAAAVHADALLLVESPDHLVVHTAEALHRRGIPSEVFTNRDGATGSVDSVGIVVTERLGSYRKTSAEQIELGAVSVVPESPGATGDFAAPPLAAVHTPPPIPGVFPASLWVEQISRAVTACSSSPGRIVGGDFNATAAQIRRAGNEGCANAGQLLGRPAIGTWPTSLPSWLGAGIDHQFADTGSWTPVEMRVVELPVSDHRALAVRYRHTAE